MVQRGESTHELGHPTGWVAPWVRSVLIESLDFPRSNHVASNESYMTLNAYHDLRCFIKAINIATPCNPTVLITLINETLGLLHFINTQGNATFGDTRSNLYTQTFGLPWIISIWSSSFPISSYLRLYVTLSQPRALT